MTVSIMQALATLPTGELGVPLSTEELGRYLGRNCNDDDDKRREQRHIKRDEIYRDGGVQYLVDLINKVFRDQKTRDLRTEWAPYARFNNALKRVVNEISTLYSEPAQRHVNGEDNHVAYRDLLVRLQFDAVMQQVNRMYNLHRALLVGFRVRELPSGDREPVVDVVTPASFRVVLHPNDATLALGYLVRTATRSVRGTEMQKPAWVMWTDHESVQLTDSFAPILPTYREHGFGVCPYLPIVRTAAQQSFWPGEEGEDLVAAAVSIWFANLLLLKETKSATKQTILAGDLAGAAREQSADSEVPNQISDGVAVTTVDMSMDLAMFRETTDHIIENVANNYGMSAALIKHQGVQSADARDLMRIPLRELRREQQPMFRLFERRFVEVMASVLKVDASDQAFLSDGWRIDFGEAQTPLTPSEELLLFEKSRAAAMDNTVAFMMRRNPDIDENTARTQIMHNIETETWRVREMRELQAMSGAMSELVAEPFTAIAPGQTDAQEPKTSTSEDQAA